MRRDSAASIAADLQQRAADTGAARLLVCFIVAIPARMAVADIRAELERQGYARVHHESPQELVVIQDRLRAGAEHAARLNEALEAALRERLNALEVSRLDMVRGFLGSGGQDVPPAKMAFYTPSAVSATCSPRR